MQCHNYENTTTASTLRQLDKADRLAGIIRRYFCFFRNLGIFALEFSTQKRRCIPKLQMSQRVQLQLTKQSY